MIKSWLIAGGLFVVAVVMSVFWGKAKQHSSDVKKASKVVQNELDKISNVAEQAKNDVAKRPDTGPDSNAQRMRDDWSEN